MRKIPLAIGEYYHICNRGVDKRETFLDHNDYQRFLLSLRLMNDKKGGLMIVWRDFHKKNLKISVESFLTSNVRKVEPIVEIIAYCLNPNHYHFILKQIEKRGIETFMQKIGNGYTKYFNTRNKRSGVLFQGKFKSVHIDSNDYLLYLSAYVNKNNFIHGYGKMRKWSYSSLWEYLGKTNQEICNKKIILDQFKNIDDYKEFLNKNAVYLKEKKELKRYLLEE